MAIDSAVRNAIHRQFLRFALVGLVSTLLDGVIYRLASTVLDVNIAKALGYIAGLSFSIACNYRWSFGYAGGRSASVITKCVLVYLLALCLNVAVNRVGLIAFGMDRYGTAWAFLIAVAASTLFNFAGMRGWVFK